MRVAILGPYPLDANLLGGGVEAAIVYLQRELVKRDQIDLHIVTCSQQISQPRVVEGDGCTVTYLRRGRRGRLTGHRAEIAALCAHLRRLQPDIVHGHMTGLYAGAALASGYPAVVTVHGIVYREAQLQETLPNKLRGLIDARYERRVVRRAPDLILITPYVQEAFSGVLTGTTYLVENACDERFFTLGPGGAGRPAPVPGRVLFAGPVIPRKGVLPLIEAMARLHERMPEAHLRIAGALDRVPEYGAACQRRVHELGLEEVVAFLGHLDQERILAEYGACAAFVLPSFQETAPVAIAQAMAAGVPCVATRAGGVPWMLQDGLTGWTLPVPQSPAGDPQTLAAALERVLADPEGALEMGRRAKAEAEVRFHPTVVARQTCEVYQRVIAAMTDGVQPRVRGS